MTEDGNELLSYLRDFKLLSKIFFGLKQLNARIEMIGDHLGEDAFCESRDWYARSYLAINQGPIVIMMEKFRTDLLWDLFMSAPEVRAGLSRLGFKSPHL